MKEPLRHVIAHPTGTQTESIRGSTLFYRCSPSVCLSVGSPAVKNQGRPPVYPVAADTRCECALCKSNRDERIRKSGRSTISFSNILDFPTVLTTSLFDRK